MHELLLALADSRSRASGHLRCHDGDQYAINTFVWIHASFEPLQAAGYRSNKLMEKQTLQHAH